MMPYAVASPSPVPSGLVMKKGSKSLSLVSSSMPMPVSLTVISANDPARDRPGIAVVYARGAKRSLNLPVQIEFSLAL